MTSVKWTCIGTVLALFASCGGSGSGGGTPSTTTTFAGTVANPTGMLQRQAEEKGVLCCALPSTLYVVVVCEDGEVSISAVSSGGSFSVTVNDTDSSVMISFVLDVGNDGDFDVFEGTLTFSTATGVTATITAGGGTVNLGTITLGAGLAETSDLSATILLSLDCDNDGISDFDDIDDDGDGDIDDLEDECDEDDDLEPDLLDEDDDNDGINDDLDPDDDNDGDPDNDADEDGCDDDVDVEIEIEINIDITFSFDLP